MKRIIQFLSIPLLAGLLFVSCDTDDTSLDASTTPVAFAPTISGAEASTRASGTKWSTGDAIGVFMKKAGGNLATTSLANNVNYTTFISKGFIATAPIYYPESGNVDFVAYYPYKYTLVDNTYKVDVSVQTAPTTIDLLYSNNAKNKSLSKTAVAMTFNHKLSRMVLNIKPGIGMTNSNLGSVTVQITGMPTKVDFKLADGTFGTPSTTTNIVPKVIKAESGYVVTCTAILVPQVANAWNNRTMVFKVGKLEYIYDIPNSHDFETGKNYPYEIEINAKSITVSRGMITDWTGTGSSGGLGEGEQTPILIPMALIPAGTFMMGSPTTEFNRDINNETQHKVTLSNDFYMSKHEISNAQYATFLNDVLVGSDGKWSAGNYSDKELIESHEFGLNWDVDKWAPQTGYANHPVVFVSWYGAMEYCTWLSGQGGSTYSLPTEAQWEYACRGGFKDKATEVPTQPFGFDNGSHLYADRANFDGSSPYDVGQEGQIDNFEGSARYPNTYYGKSTSVGSYVPNNYGLYDMHGNVVEWCLDGYMQNHQDLPETDPVNHAPDDTNRVLRGGGWDNSAQVCRAAYRGDYPPLGRYADVGFRVILVL